MHQNFLQSPPTELCEEAIKLTRLIRMRSLLLLVLLSASSGVVRCEHDGSDDPLDWLRDSIPGEPGVDYPVFAEVADTGFDCAGRVHGGQSKEITEENNNS